MMRFLWLVEIVALALVGAAYAMANPPTPATVREIAASLKTQDSANLTDLQINNIGGMQAICGKVSGRPFRILTHSDGRIESPLSLMVSKDEETARYILMLCYSDRD